MIAPVQLDFVRRVFGPRSPRVRLLVGGVALLLAVGTYEQVLAWKIDRLETDLGVVQAQVRARQPARVKLSEREINDEVSRAKNVIANLTLPWARMFAAIETSDRKSVALLSIQPDAAKRRIMIGGEAKNFDAMLEYVRQLEASKTLQNVYVVSHEVQRRDPQHPVRFMLEASWVIDG